MIVKVQVQLGVVAGTPRRVLVYTEHRAVMAELPCTDDVETLMAGRSKAYFNARVDNSTLVLMDEVESPRW